MSDKAREALLALIEAVQYTPLGIRAIKAVEQGRAALAEPAAPVAKPVMPTEAELIAIAERLGSVAELCRTEDHPNTIWRIRYEVEELVREVLKTYAVAEQPAADHELFAELYQILGELGAGEAVLDQVLAASQGEPLPHASLLPYATEQPYSTTSDQYRAELYDEVWAKARGLGYGNVTEALAELERLKSVEASPEPVKLAFPTMLRKMWSGGDVQDWLDRQGPLYRTPPAAAPQACPGCRALSAEMTALRAGRDYCGACPDGCDRCSVRENSPGDLEGDGTARAGAMGEAYLVLAEQDYESPIILRAFHSEPAAQAFAQQLRDYQGTQPEWPSIDDSEDVFARKEAAMNAWRSAHPGGEDISSRRDFAVLPVPVEQNNGVPVPVKPAGGEM